MIKARQVSVGCNETLDILRELVLLVDVVRSGVILLSVVLAILLEILQYVFGWLRLSRAVFLCISHSAMKDSAFLLLGRLM